MERRKFISALGLGSLAVGAIPLTGRAATAHFIRKGNTAEIKVLSGILECRQLSISGLGLTMQSKPVISGKMAQGKFKISGDTFRADFMQTLRIPEGESLLFS